MSKGIRFSEVEIEAATRIAKRHELSFNAYIRRLVQLDIQNQERRMSDNSQKIAGDIAIAISAVHILAGQQDPAVIDEIVAHATPIRDKIVRLFKNVDVGK